MAKTKEAKVFTPKELAEELSVDAKQIRAYLRRNHTRSDEAKRTNWNLDEKTANVVRSHFTKSDESNDDES